MFGQKKEDIAGQRENSCQHWAWLTSLWKQTLTQPGPLRISMGGLGPIYVNLTHIAPPLTWDQSLEHLPWHTTTILQLNMKNTSVRHRKSGGKDPEFFQKKTWSYEENHLLLYCSARKLRTGFQVSDSNKAHSWKDISNIKMECK